MNERTKQLRLPSYIKVTLWHAIINLLILGIRNLIVGDGFFNVLKSNLIIASMPVILFAFFLNHFYEKLRNFWFYVCTALWVYFIPTRRI